MTCAAHADAGGVDDVVKHQIAGCTGDDAHIVSLAPGRCLHGGQRTIGQNQGDDLGSIHSAFRLDAGGVDFLHGGVGIHPYKIEYVNTQIQEGAAAQGRVQHALLGGHVIAQRGREQGGLADDAGG